MTPDMLIRSGKLELFATGILPPEEMKETSLEATSQPLISDELDEIENALRKYALLHAPELRHSLLEDIIEKIHSLPEEPTRVTHPTQAERKREKKEKPRKEPQRAPKANEEKSSSNALMIFVVVILISLVGILAFYFYRELEQTKIEASRLERENALSSLENEKLKAEYEAAKAELEIYRDPQFKVISLKGQSISPASEAVVYWNPANEKTFLRVQYLPDPVANKKFYLWAINNEGSAQNAGTFNTIHNRLPLKPMGAIDSVRAFVISLEAEPVGAVPTQESVYALGNR